MKILSFLLSLFFVLSLVSCQKKTTDPDLNPFGTGGATLTISNPSDNDSSCVRILNVQINNIRLEEIVEGDSFSVAMSPGFYQVFGFVDIFCSGGFRDSFPVSEPIVVRENEVAILEI